MAVTQLSRQIVDAMEQKESLASTLALKQKAPCRHPLKSRMTDAETGEIHCHECGEVLGTVRQKAAPEEYLRRSPVNDAVHRRNMSEKTSNGQPVSHYVATSSVYGNEKYGMKALEFLTKTCPACGKQQPVRVFGETIYCENKDCSIELGHRVLRWLPFVPQDGKKNGNSENAHPMRYMADMKLLSLWDPPENDHTLKAARELFSKKVQGHVSPETAHFLAQRFLRGVRRMNKTYRKDMENLLDGLLQAEGIIVK
jgi:hypothetical protein